MNTQLTQGQIDVVIEWMNGWDVLKNTAIPIRFKEAFTPKEEDKSKEIIKGTMTWGRLVEFLTQDLESNAEIKKQILQQIVEKIYDDMKLPLKSKLKMDYDDEEESKINIGDRVKLKGDVNSPTMTVIGNVGNDARHQIGKVVQEATIQSNDILKCAYFVREEDNEIMVKPMQTVEIHKNALQKLIPTQPTNKQS